jgi:hypothetical protein
MILAEIFGCRITCVEKAEEFDSAARRRARQAGRDSLIEFVTGDRGAALRRSEGSARGAMDRDLAVLIVGSSVVEVAPAERCGAGRRCNAVARASTSAPTDR